MEVINGVKLFGLQFCVLSNKFLNPINLVSITLVADCLVLAANQNHHVSASVAVHN